MLNRSVKVSWKGKPRALSHTTIRGMMIAIAGLAMGLASLVLWSRFGEEQRLAVERLDSAKGFVAYDYRYANGAWKPAGTNPRGLMWLRQLVGIDRLHHVTYVSFHDECDREGLAALAMLGQLEELATANCGIRDADVKHIKGLTRLKRISLLGNPVGDEALKYLGEMTGLEYVSLACTKITDAGMVKLRHLTKLKRLRLFSTAIGNNGLQHLIRLSELERLDLSDTYVDDNTLIHLRRLLKLRQLVIGGCRMTNKGLEHLDGLTVLEHLGLFGGQFSDDGLANVATMKRLKVLELGPGVRVTDAGLLHISKSKNLKALHITDASGVSSEALAKLQNALPNLSITRGEKLKAWYESESLVAP